MRALLLFSLVLLYSCASNESYYVISAIHLDKNEKGVSYAEDSKLDLGDFSAKFRLNNSRGIKYRVINMFNKGDWVSSNNYFYSENSPFVLSILLDSTIGNIQFNSKSFRLYSSSSEIKLQKVLVDDSNDVHSACELGGEYKESFPELGEEYLFADGFFERDNGWKCMSLIFDEPVKNVSPEKEYRLEISYLAEGNPKSISVYMRPKDIRYVSH